jgi:hypothetical protein
VSGCRSTGETARSGRDTPVVAVVIDTCLRTGSDGFRSIRQLERYDGDPDHVEGAIVMTIDGVPLLSEADWDDVDWLWPSVVQAAEECRITGAGERRFPDQPVLFSARRLATGRLLVSVQLGDETRAATTQATEFYRALAAAGTEFFNHHRRLVRGSGGHEREAALLRTWLA